MAYHAFVDTSGLNCHRCAGPAWLRLRPAPRGTVRRECRGRAFLPELENGTRLARQSASHTAAKGRTADYIADADHCKHSPEKWHFQIQKVRVLFAQLLNANMQN
ncbi:MAG: hypothetical protein RSD99_27650 [Janthinobacterium sp.]